MKKQTEMMRELCNTFGMVETVVVREYAAAERRGEVIRRSDVNGMTAEEYAKRLWADGMRKGWLLGSPPH